MHGELIVTLCVAALVAASDTQQAPVYSSSTPSPIQYVPVPNPSGPAIYTYSSPPAQNGGTVEAYQTVTAHPPPSAYSTPAPASTAAPFDPSKYVQAPQYVGPPGAYPDAPIPDFANYQGYSGFPINYVPAPTLYTSIANSGYPMQNKARTQIKLVDSSDAYTPEFVPQYPSPSPKAGISEKSIPIPVEYPTSVGKDVGSHVVYAPIENSEGYNRPLYKPVATYAVQSAYANYAKAAAAYSQAPAVSRVNFNGLGVSYGY